MPGNCLQGSFKKSNCMDNQVLVPGTVTTYQYRCNHYFCNSDRSSRGSTAAGAEELQCLVLHMEALSGYIGGAFRQWRWQRLVEVTVIMPPASLSSCVLQSWGLKRGCPKCESSKRWVELDTPQTASGLMPGLCKSPGECCRTECSKAVLSPGLL